MRFILATMIFALALAGAALAIPDFVASSEADVLVLTHSNLATPSWDPQVMDPAHWETKLLDQKDGQGLTVARHLIQDNDDVESIKLWIETNAPQIRYLLIIGDAHEMHFDPLDEQNFSFTDVDASYGQYVPFYSQIQDTQTYGWGDRPYYYDAGYVSGIGGCAVGRIPADNRPEIIDYINKTDNYLQYTSGTWRTKIGFVGDDVDYPWNSCNPDEIHSVETSLPIPTGWTKSSVFSSDYQDHAGRKTAFEGMLNAGQGMLVGFGTGSMYNNMLAMYNEDDFATSQLSNSGEYPFMLAASCELGSVHQWEDDNGPETGCVIEELVMMPSAGLIGAIAPTDWTLQSACIEYIWQTLDLVETYPAITFGDLRTAADAAAYEEYSSYTSRATPWRMGIFNLIGDPTISLLQAPSTITVSTNTTIGPGEFYYSSKVIVTSGATLTINPGTTIYFSGKNSGLEIRSGSSLSAQGTSGSPIVFKGIIPGFRGSWSGLRFNAAVSGTSQQLEYVTIENAERALLSKAASGAFIPEYAEISDCEMAVYTEDALYTYLHDFDIHDCTHGVFVTHPSAGVNSFTLYDSDVYNITNIGVELNTMGTGYVISSRIHDCGVNGLKTNLINKLNVGSATGLVDYATRIYNNGSATEYTVPAVDIYGSTYINRWEDLQVYENLACGVFLNNGVTVNTDPLEHGMVAIGNNQQEANESYEFLIGPSCTFDFGDHQYNLFNDMVTPTPMILRLYNQQLTDAENTWWGESLTDVASVLSHVELYGTSTVDVDPLATSAFGGASWYPGTSSLDDSPESILQQAYALLDTFDTPDVDPAEAADLFELLVVEGYVPGLYGLAQALLVQEQSVNQIDAALDGLVEGASDEMIRAREFLRGDVRVRSGDFDSAQTEYMDYAANAPTVLDSLHAEMSSDEVARLQLILEQLEDGDLASLPEETARRIDEIEAHLIDLRSQMLALSNDATISHALPDKFELLAAYPNPFNPSVTIPFALPERMDVTLAIYNVLGQRVKTLVNKPLAAGYHSIAWDGSGSASAEVASGVYFVRMEIPGHIQTQKIVMMK